MSMMVVMASQVCAHIQTHLRALSTCRFLYVNYISKKLLFKKIIVLQRTRSRKLTRKSTKWENILFKRFCLNRILKLNFNSQENKKLLPSKFSIFSMLFKAKFKYSSSLSLLTFSEIQNDVINL